MVGVQVARRVKRASQLAQQPPGKAQRSVRYAVACLEEPVYLRAGPALHRAAPKWLVYTELIRTPKRAFMSGEKTFQHLSPSLILPPCAGFNPSPAGSGQKLDILLFLHFIIRD